MKNDVMIKLVGYRKILDLITDWADSGNKKIFANFSVDENKVSVVLSSLSPEVPIDDTQVAELVSLFLDGTKLIDSATDMREYELGEAGVNLNTATVDFINYATEQGFVFDTYDLRVIDEGDMISFIRTNRDFTISVNEEGKVIIA